MTIANKEVKIAFSEHIIKYLIRSEDKDVTVLRNDIEESLLRGDLEGFKKALISLFASIPYTHNTF